MAWKRWVGIALIVLSGIWFAALIAVPFLSISLEGKALLGLIFLVLMESSFWLGTLIIGKQVISKFWHRSKRKSRGKDVIACQSPIEVQHSEDTERSSSESIANQERKGFVIMMENLPYAIMLFLGAIIFLVGLDFTDIAWLLAGLYALYGVIGVFWIIVFVCPFCHNFGSECFSGHGQVSAMLMAKKDERRFVKEFKKNIPAIIPIYVIPVIAGTLFLASSFTMVLLISILLFAFNSFYLSPRISMKYACSRCSVRKECPWMGENSMFSKQMKT
jgi:hypothetical protein